MTDRPTFLPVNGLPVLVIHGRGDGRMPVSMAREFARGVANVTFYEFTGDHFLLAKEAEAVQGVIREWLVAQRNRP
jgi:pimeloyl-ACP methyl ester carboxylesterase